MPTGQYSLTDAKPIGAYSLADARPDFSTTNAKDAQGNPLVRAANATASVVGDVGRGFINGATRTMLDLGQGIHAIPGVSKAVDSLYGVNGLSDQAFTQARQDTQYKNIPQMVGGGLEMAAEAALPITKIGEAIPTTAKAGQKFQQVMAAAKDIPVDIEAPGQVALRIQQLAERGGTMPKAVRDLLKRVTNPEQGPFVYEEARDFASNISRLSADEFQRLTPTVRREVGNLRVALNGAIADAAAQAGKLNEYHAAMKEYARAMKLKDVLDAMVEGAKRGLPYATATSAGYWLTQKLKELASGD